VTVRKTYTLKYTNSSLHLYHYNYMLLETCGCQVSAGTATALFSGHPPPLLLFPAETKQTSFIRPCEYLSIHVAAAASMSTTHCFCMARRGAINACRAAATAQLPLQLPVPSTPPRRRLCAPPHGVRAREAQLAGVAPEHRCASSCFASLRGSHMGTSAAHAPDCTHASAGRY
jgi:hypothetical protein